LADESTGRSRSENLPRIYDIEFGINTINGKLNIWIDFNRNRFKNQTIQDMLQKIELNLNRIIEHCIIREASEVTPSDLTYRELAISDLENLFE
jgi:non-ribosomal peptide synthase protein (TIGR01720 family)